jgi:antitoxin component of MazEF toxin-antitoxin module
LEDALEQLRLQPERPVEAEVGGLLIEMRVKPRRSAAEAFREIGAWEGETTDELTRRLEEERRRGTSKEPPWL